MKVVLGENEWLALYPPLSSRIFRCGGLDSELNPSLYFAAYLIYDRFLGPTLSAFQFSMSATIIPLPTSYLHPLILNSDSYV